MTHALAAAHDLGTPLATLAVLVREWRGRPPTAAELLAAEAALVDARATLADLLRLMTDDATPPPSPMPLLATLSGALASWQARQRDRPLRIALDLPADLPVADPAGLRRAVWTVLDNAMRATTDRIGVAAHLSGGWAVVRVGDTGGGFSPDVLAGLGDVQPDAEGHGLGLMIANRLLAEQGGALIARNHPDGGAEVVLALPVPADG